MSGEVDKAKGRAKEAVGVLTDDEKLKQKGKLDQAAGAVKQKAEKAVDAVKNAAKKATG